MNASPSSHPGITPTQHAALAGQSPELRQPAAPLDPAMRLTAVCAALGLGRSAVYELIAAGTLARPAKIGRVSVWRQSDVNAALSRIFAKGGTQ